MIVGLFFFFFKQKTAYEIVSRDWSSDVCSSDLPRLAARGRGREGRPLGRGRRRALRRLLHLRGRPARAALRPARAARAPARRAAAVVEREGELRLPREALRPRGSPAAARAPPRLEGDLLARRPRRAHRAPNGVRSRRPAAHAV